mgnify:CR=1 FL=1
MFVLNHVSKGDGYMIITFNGTGASEGFPALFCECQHCSRARTMDEKNFRMRSSCLVDDTLLIDFSCDTYARSLYGKLDLTKVRNIIITHSHADHLYPSDLFAIMPPFAEHNRTMPLQIHGNKNVQEIVGSRIMSRPEIGKYLKFNLMESFVTYHIDEYKITPLPAYHDLKQECFIYVIQKNNKTLLCGYDSSYFPEDAWEALKYYRFDGVILDCTSGAHECPYPSHMGIPENIKVRKRMLSEGIADEGTKFILTHFAHSFAPFYDDINKIAAENGFIAAYDGFQIEI